MNGCGDLVVLSSESLKAHSLNLSRARGSLLRLQGYSASLTSLFERERAMKVISDTGGITLALTSAILMSLYSLLYKQIKDDVRTFSY